MAQIQMTEALAGALIQRFQGEYGQQAVSNFALDILLDQANGQIKTLLEDIIRKDELNAALNERATKAEAQIEEMKRAADPKRADVMGAADRVKNRQAGKNGANAHTK